MPTSTDPVSLTVAEQRAMIIASAWTVEGSGRRIMVSRPPKPRIAITRAVLDNLVRHGLMERRTVEHQPKLEGVDAEEPSRAYAWTLTDAGVERLQADAATRRLERKDDPVAGWGPKLDAFASLRRKQRR